MVFNATFNNISFISWRSVVLMENTGVPRENHGTVDNVGIPMGTNGVPLLSNLFPFTAILIDVITGQHRPYVDLHSLSR